MEKQSIIFEIVGMNILYPFKISYDKFSAIWAIPEKFDESKKQVEERYNGLEQIPSTEKYDVIRTGNKYRCFLILILKEESSYNFDSIEDYLSLISNFIKSFHLFQQSELFIKTIHHIIEKTLFKTICPSRRSISIPFREDAPQLTFGDNLFQAGRGFACIWAAFDKKPEYLQIIDDYARTFHEPNLEQEAAQTWNALEHISAIIGRFQKINYLIDENEWEKLKLQLKKSIDEKLSELINDNMIGIASKNKKYVIENLIRSLWKYPPPKHKLECICKKFGIEYKANYEESVKFLYNIRNSVYHEGYYGKELITKNNKFKNRYKYIEDIINDIRVGRKLIRLLIMQVFGLKDVLNQYFGHFTWNTQSNQEIINSEGFNDLSIYCKNVISNFDNIPEDYFSILNNFQSKINLIKAEIIINKREIISDIHLDLNSTSGDFLPEDFENFNEQISPLLKANYLKQLIINYRNEQIKLLDVIFSTFPLSFKFNFKGFERIYCKA